MNPETIRIERTALAEGSLAVIRLARPEVRNAIDLAMIHEIGAALDTLALDGETRCVVFTGSERAFASGADIAELRERRLPEALERINASLFRRIEEYALPTIAAVSGYALGGGCELAMSCDLRVAGKSAKFGQPEVGLGILPGAGAIQRLPRLVGLGRAKELIFTGRIIDAAEALSIGLVNRVVEDEHVLTAALELAETVARQGGLAVRIAKAALNAAGGTSTPYDILEMLGQAVCFESDDKRARMTAFLERKKKTPEVPK